MKALFVVNERSGRRRAFDVAEVIRRTVEQPFEIVACGRKEDLDALIDRAELEGFDVVYAVGGDGTVRETAKRLIGRRAALGILPIGSGNGFARHIGLPIDPVRSLRASGAGTIVSVDSGEVNGEPFFGVMGIGFDATVAERFELSPGRGLRTYIREILLTLPTFHAEEYTIETRETSIRQQAFVIAVANSAQYGNNARIAPLASMQDGLLDVVIVSNPPLARWLLLLPRLFVGTIHLSAGVQSLKTPEVTIRRAKPGPVQLDGELYELPEELRIRVMPRSLNVLVPNAARRL